MMAKRPYVRVTDEMGRAMALEYRSGLTIQQISVLYGLSETSVGAALRRQGVKMRPPGTPPKFSGDRRMAIKRLHEQYGNTYKQLAEMTGLSTSTIGRICLDQYTRREGWE